MTAPAIGILGGTFDPIHLGHLRLAEEVADALGLAQVRFIPAAMPPHRDAPHSSAAHRVAMTRLAIADNPRFVLDDRETRRAGPSYTVDTLSEIRGEVGANIPLALIMGADAFAKFDTWRRWQDIFSLAHIAVAHRPGTTLDALPGVLVDAWRARRVSASDALQTSAGAILEVEITALDISATRIRAQWAERKSARYLVAPDVLQYIEHNALFLNGN